MVRCISMIKDKIQTKELVEKYINQRNSRWNLANKILYEMCEDYPYHQNEDEIVAKIWLIGRSYAAAIERRKNAEGFKGDFYYDAVAPKLLEVGKQLDTKINNLFSDFEDSDFFIKLFDCHFFLTNIFKSLTELDKRSLSSKYLHFHKPHCVFIYDSITRSNINKLVTKDKEKIELYKGFDKEYVDYCIRIVELQKFIQKDFGLKLTPREIDTFLLNMEI